LPPADILTRIVAARRQRLGLPPTPQAPPPFAGDVLLQTSLSSNPFLGALRARWGRAIIAEVKMGSPRLGSLAERFDPERQAMSYSIGGAAALSVVVEPDFFFGSYDLLTRCKAASGLPAIAKDFLVSELQIDQAAEAGADAFLLIASLFSAAEILAWAHAVRARGLVPLVETHDEDDLAKLAGAPWEMVGINNRDLKTFEVSLEASIALRGLVPPGAVAVAESGIASREDVLRLRAAGFDAFLVGESLLLADDPAAKLRELLA
jgi:indole-3-glycerol phosphate synthase